MQLPWFLSEIGPAAMLNERKACVQWRPAPSCYVPEVENTKHIKLFPVCNVQHIYATFIFKVCEKETSFLMFISVTIMIICLFVLVKRLLVTMYTK